jgi:hypothetical protein
VRERLPLFAGLALLAAAVALGSAFIGDGIRNRNQADVITVTGSAKQRIVSDYVVLPASLTARAPAPADASRQLAQWTSRVRSFYAAHGVGGDELTVAPVSVVAPGGFDDQGNKVTDYQLTRRFEVRSARVQAVGALAEATSSLLAEGVPLAVEPAQYVYTKLPKLRPQLIRAAIKDAQLRARVLVEATGAKLGKVRGVNVGVFQVTAPNSTEVSDYGTYDTTTLQKDVTGVVNVTFALG